MGQTRTDEFRKDAVRIALTSGLTRKQIASDLGVGMSTLNKWITAHRDTDVVSVEDRELARENERLRRENRILKEERDILKNRHGPQPACARLKRPVLSSSAEGSCRSLIGGTDPVKKRGTWADAHLRMVTPPRR